MNTFVGFLRSKEMDIKVYNHLYTKAKDQIASSLNTLGERAVASIPKDDPKEGNTYCDEYLFLYTYQKDRKERVHPSFLTYDSEKYLLLFSGRIYNYDELKSKVALKSKVQLKDKGEESIGELLVTLFEELGKDFVKVIRGMFSIIIWNKLDKTFFGARDHFGMRPFYYKETVDGLYFSFEARNLFSKLKETGEINKVGLQNYLTFQFVPEPETMKEDVYSLMPGSIMEKSPEKEDQIRIEKYWTAKLSPIRESQDKKMKDIRRVVMDSVERHMKGDLPIGSFLSGGIDSAILTSIAKDINPKIKLFTAGFDVAGYSEIDLAENISKAYGTDHISKLINHEEFIEAFPKIIWHMGVPVADPAAIPLYFIAGEAKDHIKVVLSGEGSDEFFGGYNIYREPMSLRIFDKIPDRIKKVLLYLSDLIPDGVKGKSFIYRGCTPIEKRYTGNAHIFMENEKHKFLKDYNEKYTFDLVTKPYYDQAKDYHPVNKMQFIDINTWLTSDILVQAYKMTQAHSLELRSPFLDKKVFEVAASLQVEDKINSKTTKYILRQAFKDRIPYDVINRKKLGFPVPIRVWLKDEIYDWAMNTVKQSNADEYINKKETIKLLEEHQKGKKDNSRKIWTILNFMIWFELFCVSGNSNCLNGANLMV